MMTGNGGPEYMGRKASPAFQEDTPTDLSGPAFHLCLLGEAEPCFKSSSCGMSLMIYFPPVSLIYRV